jgi:hypothetical protein
MPAASTRSTTAAAGHTLAAIVARGPELAIHDHRPATATLPIVIASTDDTPL